MREQGDILVGLGDGWEIQVGTIHRNAVDATTGATDERVRRGAAAVAASWAGRSAALRAAH